MPGRSHPTCRVRRFRIDAGDGQKDSRLGDARPAYGSLSPTKRWNERGDCRYWHNADRFSARTNVRMFESLSYDIRSAVTIVPAQRTIGGISIGLHPSSRETGMSKSVIRLLTLTIYA